MRANTLTVIKFEKYLQKYYSVHRPNRIAFTNVIKFYIVGEFFYMHIDFTSRVAREYLNTEKNIPARHLIP